jgi:CDP-diacylglycerol--serine O-phosphatidyltransferase
MSARWRTSPADLFTIANGVCGFLALAVAAELWLGRRGEGAALDHRKLVICLLLYAIGMLCDVLDGPLARHFGSSGLGPALDTICDSISFGMLPAMLLLARLHDARDWKVPLVLITCAYVGSTILRLARYARGEAAAREAVARGDASPQARGDFSGMPSPVCGNCVLAVVVLGASAAVSVTLVALVAVLAVADFPYPHNAAIAGAFVAVLLALSFAALAGLFSLDVPSVVALVGLLPVGVLRAGETLLGRVGRAREAKVLHGA